MDIESAIKAAVEHYQAGRLQHAEDGLKKVLHLESKNITAISLLGIISYQLKKYDPAIGYMKNLIELNPSNAQAYYIIGHSLQEKGRLDEAAVYYQKALDYDSRFPDAHYNLGTIFQDRKKHNEAISCYQKALEINPMDADAYYNLGRVLQDERKLGEAVTCYQKALQINPNLADAHNNIGSILLNKRQLDEAMSCYQKAIRINPNLADAHNNIGLVLYKKGLLEAAEKYYQKALQINPNFAKAYNNLGMIYKDKGQIDEAEVFIKHAIRIQPDDVTISEGLPGVMLYNVRHNGKTIFSEHMKFAKQLETALFQEIQPYSNSKIADRRLRIGYVSPDFKKHSVAYFLEPVLTSHLRKHVDIFCYATSFDRDEMTERLRRHADHWRDITELSDETAAELIRRDGIDILVDLAGHTADNRIALFALKPAPVQVSWLGYPATTGLSTIGYKIVDAYTDPPGMTEEFYSEKLVRLPESFLCYLPEKNCPEAGDLPALTSGHITFGSCNNFAKVSPEVIDLWTAILKKVPGSRLLMKARSLSDRSVREYVLNLFRLKAVAPEVIEIIGWQSSAEEHMATYNRIDIGLDTFPYNGTTTTCEALWMGVPVITLAGTTHASRVGVSLLSNIGLKELIADRPEEYVEMAVHLAKDMKKLQSLRKGLRKMTAQSPLMDARRFTAHLETCFRNLWDNWCKSH